MRPAGRAREASVLRRLDISLLGGFRVGVERKPVGEAAWQQRRPADFVKLLELAPRHRMSREGGRRGAVAASHRGCGSREPAKGGARRLRSAIVPAVMLRGGQVAPEAEAEAQTDVRRFEDTGDVGLYAGNLLPADPTKGERSRRAIASGARLFGVRQSNRPTPTTIKVRIPAEVPPRDTPRCSAEGNLRFSR